MGSSVKTYCQAAEGGDDHVLFEGVVAQSVRIVKRKANEHSITAATYSAIIK